MKTVLRLGITAIVLALCSGAGSRAEAQITGCGNCGYGPGGTHTFAQNGFVVTCQGWQDSGCHDEVKNGSCTAVHYESCGEPPDAMVTAAMKSGNQDKLLAAIVVNKMKGDTRIVFNAKRKAYQVMDCTGKFVIAHVPLRQSKAALAD